MRADECGRSLLHGRERQIFGKHPGAVVLEDAQVVRRHGRDDAVHICAHLGVVPRMKP